MTFFEIIRQQYHQFLSNIANYYKNEANRDKEILLSSIKEKLEFLSMQELDSIDLDNLEEANELLMTICEDYNYDAKTNTTTND